MAWYIPILIFFARICDVSIGTVRTMLVIAGHKYLSACLGFFEVLVWVLALGAATKYLTYPLALVGYAAGFAAGIFCGMWIEDRMALGYRLVRIITPTPDVGICASLRDRGYRVTQVDGRGRSGPVELAFLVVRRNRLGEVRAIVEELAPEAFISVERVDHASGGGFSDSRFGRSLVERLFPARK